MNGSYSFIDRITEKLSECSSFRIVVIGTLFVLLGSIPLVYFFASVFGVEYTMFFFFLSVALPLLLSPVTLFLFIKMTRYLSYFKKHLEEEIEENKRKDTIIHEQARFALMGEMMANISHQWKQPLNTIGLSIVKARVNKDEYLDESFDVIEDNINYLASTIDDFMSFFDKRTSSEVRGIDEIIQEVNSIFNITITDENIDMKIDFSDSNKVLYMGSSISQVLLNLLNNAKDALQESEKNKNLLLRFIYNDDSLSIFCCDNGKGIKQDIKEKIFTPYFTTKEKKQGTGIGLYMSKQIINRFFSGTIEVIDKKDFEREFEDMCTCFKISIPYSQNCNLKDVA